MYKNKIFIIAIIFLSGCATVPKHDYTSFNAVSPRSILVVPVVNKTTDVDAPNYFLSSISIPLGELGYYVFPVNMVKRMLEDDGLSDADFVHNADSQKLASLFGTDSVMYVSILKWEAQYLIFSTKTTVALEYVIKDPKTNSVIWSDKETVVYQPNSNSSGNPLADLIAQAIVAAIDRAMPQYMPLAKQANAQAFLGYPNAGLPNGPYKVVK